MHHRHHREVAGCTAVVCISVGTDNNAGVKETVNADFFEHRTAVLIEASISGIQNHLAVFAGMEFEVWESLGGHIAGQLLLFEPNFGLLFTSDAFINFATLSKARADYCSIADSMIGSVNVDSEIARAERKELTRLAVELDAELKKNGKKLLICCGHGAVSEIDAEGKLVPAAELIHYAAE